MVTAGLDTRLNLSSDDTTTGGVYCVARSQVADNW
jgi:hypothetical protein